MNSITGAILLIAGTCIGSGMIALPLVLAKLGIIPSFIVMIFMWFVMYYSSLINLELNLQADHGMTLGDLGKKFSGIGAKWIGITSLKTLSYSLLAVFIYGGSSIFQELLDVYSFPKIASYYAACSLILLLLPLKLVDYINRALFASLIGVIALLTGGLVLSIDWTQLPLFGTRAADIFAYAELLPVVFTSFGFQVIFHTLVNSYNKDKKLLKTAFFWGSLIPAIVYILWSSSILSVVYKDDPQFYLQMMADRAEIGELIEILSGISQWKFVQALVWWISTLAIATSVLGVGVGLCESIQIMLPTFIRHKDMRRFTAAALTILPAYLIALLVPNAFIAVLGFAGMILAVIAILLPTYLLYKIQSKKLYYPELKQKPLIWLCLLTALCVIASQIYNMS